MSALAVEIPGVRVKLPKLISEAEVETMNAMPAIEEEITFPCTLTEEVDINTLDKVLKHPLVRDETKTLLRSYRRLIKNGRVEVKYDWCKSYRDKRLGRVYADRDLSLQNFPRAVRKALAGDKYWDIDLVAAQPALLVAICNDNNWACPVVKHYIENRKAILEATQAHYNVERDTAKDLYNRMLYMGGEQQYRKDINRLDVTPFPFAIQFRAEIEKVVMNFMTHFKDIKEKVNKVKKLKKDADGFETKGAVMSFVLQTEEHKVLTAVMKYLNSIGRPACVLIYDGCLIKKLPGETEFPTHILEGLPEWVEERTSYSMSWLGKAISCDSSEELLNLDEITIDESASTGEIDDLYATKVFIELMGDNLQKDCGQVYVFDTNIGMWSNKEEYLMGAITRLADKLCFKVSSEDAKGNERVITHNYGGCVDKMKKIVALLPSQLPETEFMTRNLDSSKYKLLFADGIYDMNTGIFTPGFDPKIVFLARINRKFPRQDERDYALERKIKKMFFVEVFANDSELAEWEDIATDKERKVPDMGKFYLNAITYGIAGEYRIKKFYIAIGPSNCGKGAATDALKATFGGFVETFNANNLKYNPRNGQDESKKLEWMTKKMTARLLIGNELRMDKQPLDGNQIKPMSSGGDDIEMRGNHQDTYKVKCRLTTILLANDMCPIAPVDDGVLTRLRYMRYNKKYVSKPRDECAEDELPADPTLKDKFDTNDKWKNALFWVIAENWKELNEPLMNDRNEEIPKPYYDPECVRNETAEWVGKDPTGNFKEMIEGGFEITKNEADKVAFSAIKEYLKRDCGLGDAWSDTKIGRELTKLSGFAGVAGKVDGSKKTTMVRPGFRRIDE